MTITKESWGLLLVLFSTILYSIMGACLKKTSEYGIPATELVFFRAVFEFIFVFLGMFFFRTTPDVTSTTTVDKDGNDVETVLNSQNDGKKDENRIHSEEVLLNSKSQKECGELLIWVPIGKAGTERKVILLRGLIGGAFGFSCYFYSIKTLPLGDAITLLSLYPIYTILMANFFLNEPITCRHVIITLLSVIGGVLIAGPSFLRRSTNPPSEMYNPLGYVTSFVGGTFIASVTILVRKAGTLGIHTLQLLFSWCLFGIAGSIIIGMTFGRSIEGEWMIPVQSEAWFLLFFTCAIGTVAHGLVNYAGRFVPAGLCSIIRSTDILWAYLLEVFVFHQVLTSTTIIGVALVVTSMSIIAWGKIQEEQNRMKPASNVQSAGASQSLLDGSKRIEDYNSTYTVNKQ